MDLSDAVRDGDLESIRAILDAGADVRYVRPHNYTVLIDVIYGRADIENGQLIPLLRLLIQRGADLNAVSDYGESAECGNDRCVWSVQTTIAPTNDRREPAVRF